MLLGLWHSSRRDKAEAEKQQVVDAIEMVEVEKEKADEQPES